MIIFLQKSGINVLTKCKPDINISDKIIFKIKEKPIIITFKDFGSFGRFFLQFMKVMGRVDVSIDTDKKEPIINISEPE